MCQVATVQVKVSKQAEKVERKKAHKFVRQSEGEKVKVEVEAEGKEEEQEAKRRRKSRSRQVKMVEKRLQQQVMMLVVVVVLLVALSEQQKYASALVVGGSMRQQIALQKSAPLVKFRDPMPWEDGYFDPSYHAWPKGKQVNKLTSEQSESAKAKR